MHSTSSSSIRDADSAPSNPILPTLISGVVLGCALLLSPLATAQNKANAASTPAERKIAGAENFIAKNATSATGYVELAMAYARRARETANDEFYDKAMVAVDKALAVDATNFEAKKARVWILLGQHDFAKAAAEAKVLNALVPDDVTVYGLMTDAFIELGQYEAAEKAAQWMLDLRAGNLAGLARGAYLRELFGDIEGALEMMDTALRRISENEYEERAWLLTHVGHLQLLIGRTDLAEQIVNEALQIFPDYHYALAKLAQVRAKQGRASEAAQLFNKRYEIASHPENLFEAAVAMHAAGLRKEASAAFKKFEVEALKESASVDNANRELARYYADYANKPADALRIAKLESTRRQDVHTLAVYAWALHKNGKAKEAFAISESATKIGTKDARVRYYAGVIAAANKDRNKAKEHFTVAANTAKEIELARSIKLAMAQ
jgi:tetratricopeptide (TPR) repeat protein